MLKEDVAAYERVLLEAFPDLRFLPRDYWKVVEKEAEKSGGIPRTWPVSLPVPYRDHLQVDDQIFMMAWREPPGWTPIWGRRADSGVMVILNRPERHFFYDRTLGPFSRDERQILDDGRIWSSDDKEQKAFVAKVIRLVAKVATNKLAGFVPGSRTELMAVTGCYVWVGPPCHPMVPRGHPSPGRRRPSPRRGRDQPAAAARRVSTTSSLAPHERRRGPDAALQSSRRFFQLALWSIDLQVLLHPAMARTG